MTEAFSMYCALIGFDLPGFDRWLDELGECGAKRELMQRRELALQAFQGRAKDGKIQMNLDKDRADDVKRHLEWLMLRRREIETADTVAPVARMGKEFSERQRAAARARWADSGTVNESIRALALSAEYRDFRPGELWSHLYADLDAARLNPCEIGTGLDKLYRYDGGEIKYENFRKLVARARA